MKEETHFWFPRQNLSVECSVRTEWKSEWRWSRMYMWWCWLCGFVGVSVYACIWFKSCCHATVKQILKVLCVHFFNGKISQSNYLWCLDEITSNKWTHSEDSFPIIPVTPIQPPALVEDKHIGSKFCHLPFILPSVMTRICKLCLCCKNDLTAHSLCHKAAAKQCTVMHMWMHRMSCHPCFYV